MFEGGGRRAKRGGKRGAGGQGRRGGGGKEGARGGGGQGIFFWNRFFKVSLDPLGQKIWGKRDWKDSLTLGSGWLGPRTSSSIPFALHSSEVRSPG